MKTIFAVIKNIFFLISILMIISCNKNVSNNNQNNNSSSISIDKLIKASRNTSFSDSIRNNHIKNVYKNIEKIENDSLKTKYLIRIAYSNYLLGNLDDFGKINLKTLDFSTLNNDSINTAKIFYNLGYYYQLKNKPDSAFYFYNQALKVHSKMNNSLLEGRDLLAMATIQSVERDFIGSEIATFKALSKLKNSNKYEALFLCYNNLAFISSQLKDFEKSIKYREKGMEYLAELKNSEYYTLITLNGIGMSYHDKGDYINSIKYFEKGLEYDNILKKYPENYSFLIDNLAYSKFKLGLNKNLLQLFYKSLKIRDSLQYDFGLIMSNLHLAEYNLSKKDTLKAIQFALKAEKLAKQSNLNIDLLETYLLLSKLHANEKGKEYLQKHIQLTDSLQHQERIIREKFTRIAYETNEITEEKEEVSKKNWILTLILLIGTAFSLLVFIFIKQRSKNKELLFNKKQDEANVEIYNLMLSQQSTFQEGSNKEKRRISEELHDGVLGRLFGTRLSLDSLNEGKTENEIKEREEYIEELQLIEEDIRKISHNLKTNLFNSNTSFIKLVEQLIAKQRKISNFECELNFNNLTTWDSISNSIKINCYRIVQESLQNINKYAKASKVQINFYKEDEKLVLTVKDNGVGYSTRNKIKGIGQKNMKSRAKSLNGNVEIISSLGKGTSIKMTIPL
jgi:two-component system, NarL family, sensor kinase